MKHRVGLYMDIHGKSVDMDMNGEFHIRGKPGNICSVLHSHRYYSVSQFVFFV